MDEIMVPKKWVVAVLVIIGLGAGLLWGVPKVLGRSPLAESVASTQMPIQDTGSSPDDGAAQKAAAVGAQAFYTVDYQKGQQDWLDRLCSVSTQTGCIVYQNVIGSNLWSGFEQSQTDISVKVTVQVLWRLLSLFRGAHIRNRMDRDNCQIRKGG